MEGSSRQPDHGRRLLTHVIDERARNGHHRPYASIPISKNAEDGFRDVSYPTFANAINRCALWLNAGVGHSTRFEKLAYMGPNDLRYPILCIAANKIGYVVSRVSSQRYRSVADSIADVLSFPEEQLGCAHVVVRRKRH